MSNRPGSAGQLARIQLEMTIQDMSHHVVQHLAVHQGDMREAVKERMKYLTTSGVVKRKIEEAVDRNLQEAIDSAVKAAFTRYARNSPTVHQAITSALNDALLEMDR